MLDIDNSALIIIDVQGKLAHAMPDKALFFANLERMVLAAKAINLPIILVEQLPDKLGHTITEIAQHLEGQLPIKKACFSAAGHPAFLDRLRELGKKQVLVMGIEAHICVMQTVLDLLNHDYETHLICDAIRSRDPNNRQLAIERCASAGAILSSVEMALFELMRDAQHPQFKTIQQLIK